LLEALRQAEAGPGVIAAALVAAAAWGAGHALTPGHGKALAAAYLVGSRSTPVHALILGLTVTATHTLGVFALGLVALFASRYVLPEQLTPWLELLSGAIVVVLGAALLVARTRRLVATGEAHHHHDHGHSPQHGHSHGPDHSHGHGRGHAHGGHHHLHAPVPSRDAGAPVSRSALLGLGVSGGLVPCPAALVLLLAAVSVDRTAFGMALVLAFSAGLAGVLTAVGLLFVKGSALAQRLPRTPAAARYLPVASALLILALGGWLTAESVHHLWPR
jgi:ABC-type nickel/cobalt efflux system permease component RcnA